MSLVFACGVSFVVYLVFPPAPVNVLLLGVDARPGEGLATRTDAIVVLGVRPVRLQVSAFSIPRDLFVEVPGYGLQRVNTVNALGEMERAGEGPLLLARSVAQNFDIGTPRYVRLDFGGFQQLINAVGGLMIDVPNMIVDNAYPAPDGGVISIRFDPGLQYMDGERALMYVRTRHSDDDYRRAERQQQVIQALSYKLINPLNWPSLAQFLLTSADTNLTLGDVLAMTPALIVNVGRYDQLVIDRALISATAEGVAVPDYGALRPWLDDRFD
jgi:LCP family protein required for cell wall assembly